jgi:hypothetical protein
MKLVVAGMLVAAMALIAASCAARPAGSILAVEDRQAIDQLVAGTYTRALDSGKWTDYAATFAEDGELTGWPTQSLKGRAAIEKFFTTPGNVPAPPPGGLRHVVTNLSYTIEENKATGGAYWQSVGIANGYPAVLAAGHYEDVRKEGEQWKFVKRAIVIDILPSNSSVPTASAQPR